jgi:hypothetical protein
MHDSFAEGSVQRGLKPSLARGLGDVPPNFESNSPFSLWEKGVRGMRVGVERGWRDLGRKSVV